MCPPAKKTSPAAPKRAKRYASGLPIGDILHDLMRRQALPAQSPAQLHCRSALLGAIPAEWREHVRLGTLNFQRWEIFVADSALSYRLQFLAPEIRRVVGEKVPHVPELIIKVDPGLKTLHTHRPRHSLPAPRERLSPQETDRILGAFFARHGRHGA